MPERHRLGGLQVREPRHYGCGVVERLRGQRVLIVAQQSVDVVDRVAQVKPEIGGDLVVTRARGVQPPGRRSDQLGEPRFDVHMDVFQLALEDEAVLLDL
jgi:hypothetical protein